MEKDGGVLSAADRQTIVDWVYANQIIVPQSEPRQMRGHAGFIGGTFMGSPFRSSRAISEQLDTQDNSVPPNTPNDAANVSQHNFAHIAMTYTALCVLAILGDDFSRVRKHDILYALGKLQRKDGKSPIA